MRRVVLSLSVAAACLLGVAGKAVAEPKEGMCDVPKMKTEKWQSRSEVGGMTILLPPGFGSGGIGSSTGTEESGAHYYHNGEHRLLILGFGSGLQSILRDPDVTEKSECETVIGGRRVLITVYNWVNEDRALSASGNAGARFLSVARYYATGSSPAVFVAFISNVPYEVMSFKPIFWTVSFGEATPAPAATLVAANPATAPAAGPACTPAPPLPNLPLASAVIDSAVVQSLLAGAAPIPTGYEVMKLQFDTSGELAGMAVAQSDLPEASQRELAAVVGTNLKPHDGKAPASILLRIDAAATGLRYSVISPSSCAQ
jgi:hypothetical protein